MDKDIKKILTDAGWYNKRAINILDMEKILVEKNYTVFKCAKSFLSEYGLLKITFINPRNGKNVDMEIDTRKTTTFKIVIDSYGRYCNTKMLPIAEIARLSMTVCISEEGKFYGGCDESLVKLGDNFEEAMFNLIMGTKREKVYVELES